MGTLAFCRVPGKFRRASWMFSFVRFDGGAGFNRRKLLDAITALRMDSNTQAAANSTIDRPPENSAERRQVTVMFCDLAGPTLGSSPSSVLSSGTGASVLGPGLRAKSIAEERVCLNKRTRWPVE